MSNSAYLMAVAPDHTTGEVHVFRIDRETTEVVDAVTYSPKEARMVGDLMERAAGVVETITELVDDRVLP